MAYTNFPNGLTSFGVPLVGPGGNLPIGGNYWFVNSATGSNGNPGTFDAPFSTLAFALSQGGLAAGDIVVVAEGHAENVAAAAGILASVAGVQVVGLGSGTKAPTFTFITATTATFKVTGAGVVIGPGLRFVNGIASLATMLDVQAKGVVVQGNAFVEGAATTGLSFIDLVGATANASDGLAIRGNTFYNPTAGNYNHAVGLTTVQDNVEVGNNFVDGQWALSGIHNVTAKVLTNVRVHDNYVRNLTAAKPALNFVSAVTGQAYNNIFVPGDSSVNSAIYGTALNAVGNNVTIRGRDDIGEEFWYVKKGVVSSTVTQAGLDISVASIGGEIAIEYAIVKTNATGLAGGTNFQITTNNTNGQANMFVETVANLGANKTVDSFTTSVAAGKVGAVLELGKKLTLKSTVADCTGAGTIDIYLRCKRLTAGADLSAA